MRRTLRDRLVEQYRSFRVRRAGGQEVARVYRNPAGLFAVSSEDTLIGYTLRRGERWSGDFLDRLIAMVRPDMSVLVVGGHVGTIAIPLSKHVRAMTIVEANPNTFPLLAANVALNRAKNVRLVPIAAGESYGAIDFLASRRNSGGAKRRPLVADERYLFDDPEVLRVEMAPLDDLLAGKFDLIVMDIEGSEVFALRGMQRILAEANTLVVEFCAHHLQNVGGVTMPEFYAAIGDAFDCLEVPEEGAHVEGPAIVTCLQSLFDREIGCDGIVFSKSATSDQVNGLPESTCVTPSRTAYEPAAMESSKKPALAL